MAVVENGPGTVVLGTDDRALAVTAVKARLRVASADEDALIAAFAETALGLCEQVTGQVTIARPMRQALAGGGGWRRLGATPVRAVTAVTDPDGTALAAGLYAIDIDGDGAGWVRTPPDRAVRAAFTAGLAGGWDTLPAALREGAAMLAAHLFDDRAGREPVPAAVFALWRPFRALRLTAGRSTAGMRT